MRMAIAVLFVSIAPAMAAEETQCFEVVSAGPNIVPNSFIKINKCTGQSWVLVKTTLPKAKNEVDTPFTYRWMMLNSEDREPSMVSRSQMNP